MDFLNRGRWFFDPARGLMRSCKNPQQDDSALRKYWTKERLQLEHQGAGGADKQGNVEESSKACEISVKPKPAVNRGNVKGKREPKTDSKAGSKPALKKRGRKPILIESSDDATEDEGVVDVDAEGPPSPKKTRASGKEAKVAHPQPPVANNLIAIMPPAASIEAPMPPSVGTDVKKAAPPKAHVLKEPAEFQADFPPATTPAGMMQLMMSIAYDNASVSARRHDLERRERELERRERFQEEQAEKASFMANAADAFKHLYSRP